MLSITWILFAMCYVSPNQNLPQSSVDAAPVKTCIISSLYRITMVVSQIISETNESHKIDIGNDISDVESKSCVVDSYTEEEIKSEKSELSRY